MKITNENRAIWLALHQAAMEFRDLKPWQWMTDADLFAIKAPSTDEIGFACIMGNGGFMEGFALYMGKEGIESYQQLLKEAKEDMFSEQTRSRHAVLSQKCLITYFGNRQELEEQDLKQIKALGLRYKGKNQWIYFRDFTPGFAPWFLNEEKVVTLTHAFQQAVIVAKQFQKNPFIFPPDGDAFDYLLRIAEKKEDNILEWTTKFINLEEYFKEQPVSQKTNVRRMISAKKIDRAKQNAPLQPNTLLFRICRIPMGISDSPDKRPIYPYISLFAKPKSGFIIAMNIYQNDGDNLYPEFEEQLFSVFEQIGFTPNNIQVSDDFSEELLQPYSQALGFTIEKVDYIDEIDDAIAFLINISREREQMMNPF